MAEHRVILLGKTGNGKSSTGNSILGCTAFKTDVSPDSVTLNCAILTKKRDDGRVFTVCDTPGLFCVSEDPIEMALKVQQSVEICPHPHVFLLVFSAACRMTTDEKKTIDLLRIVFGDKMFEHCIVVITRGNELKSQSKFENYLTKNVEMKKIKEKCGDRVVKIENDEDYPARSDLGGLLNMIEQLANNTSYDFKYLKTHSKVLQEYKHTYGECKPEDTDKHINEILNKIEKKLEKERKNAEEERKKLDKKIKETNDKEKELEYKAKILADTQRNQDIMSASLAIVAGVAGVAGIVYLGPTSTVISTVVRVTLSNGALAGGALSGGALSGGALAGGALSGGALSCGALAGGALSGGALARGALACGALAGGALLGSTRDEEKKKEKN